MKFYDEEKKENACEEEIYEEKTDEKEYEKEINEKEKTIVSSKKSSRS